MHQNYTSGNHKETSVLGLENGKHLRAYVRTCQLNKDLDEVLDYHITDQATLHSIDGKMKNT